MAIASKPRVLVADDQSEILEALDLALRPAGYVVDAVRTVALALEAVLLQGDEYDAALIDLNYARDTTSGREGLDLLAEIRAADPGLPVVVMTRWATIDLAVEAMRRGARDFLRKPWENARLLTLLQSQVELRRALRAARRLEAENALLRADPNRRIVAQSPAMVEVMATVARIGPSEAAVLITGEHGTGKEVVAHALHALSPRADKAWIPVNTGALPETLFESELFGHVKGAFTDARTDRIGRFELADGGTLFLDEIGNLPLRQQAALLRALQSGEIERVGSARPRPVDVRLIAATNADLRAACAAGAFRDDLLFRLNTVEIQLPPLRRRPEDIAPLAAVFLERQAARYRRPIEGFEAPAMQALMQHSWPGNVRELEHVVERAVLMCRTARIQVADLGLAAQVGAKNIDEVSLEEVEAILIRKALQRHAGNISQAAAALGLSRAALYRRIEKYGL